MAGSYDMSINQGADYKLSLTIKDELGDPVDLTNHTFTGQIRKTASDPIVQASFSFTILDQVANTGRVDVLLSAAVSSGIQLERSTGVNKKITQMAYDIESDNGSGEIVRWLEGIVEFSPEVTK
jgi:hypothetical protein